MLDEVLAAVDIGTHSTRLLIRSGSQDLVRLVELTQLGEGLGETSRLSEPAMARVHAALRLYRSQMDLHGVTSMRVVATSAARDALNRDDFFASCQTILGHEVELLSGDQEAALSFAGAVACLDSATGPFLVIDIGGGSTEFAFGHTSCEDSISLDVGSVRLSELYIESDPPLPEELSACVTVMGAWLDDVDREVSGVRDAVTVVGVGGTVATAVAVELGLASYDRSQIHHFVLTRDAAEDVFRTLATEDRCDRAANPGLPAERVDTIVGGMAILVKTMRHFELDEILASEDDLLDGLVHSLRR